MFDKMSELFEREAGHILVGFLMMITGAIFYELSIPKGEDVIVAGLTITVRALIGHGNGKTKTNANGNTV